ncbi:MAG: MFS transporter [Chloroflexi bacterium]|nr:MFS transporter [Chloroflexota bacterium]
MTPESASFSFPPAETRRRRLAQTAGYCLAFVALGLFSASLGPTLPGLARHTQARLNEISYLFTARALGYLIGSFIGGRFYDRLKGHLVMAGVLALMAVMMALVPLVPLLALLAVALALLGIGEGALDVGGNTLIVWVHGERVGPYMNALHFCFGLGAFVSPIIIAQAVLFSGDINWAYWALALLMLPAFLWLLRTPSPPSPAAGGNGANGPARPLLVVAISLFLLLYVGAESSFGGWVYTYAMTRGLGTATSAAYLTSAFWGALTLGRLLSIPLAARFKLATVLLADLVGCLAGVAILVVLPGSVVALWVGALLTGFGMSAIFPTAIALAGSRMTLTGRVTGWFLVGASVGSMTMPWLIGQLFERIGPQVAMWLILADLIAALGVFAVMMRGDFDR